jgi:hypothetical protein
MGGLGLRPRVVNKLVDDTGRGDALPLLAYTLQALCCVEPGGMVTAEDAISLVVWWVRCPSKLTG